MGTGRASAMARLSGVVVRPRGGWRVPILTTVGPETRKPGPASAEAAPVAPSVAARRGRQGLAELGRPEPGRAQPVRGPSGPVQAPSPAGARRRAVVVLARGEAVAARARRGAGAALTWRLVVPQPRAAATALEPPPLAARQPEARRWVSRPRRWGPHRANRPLLLPSPPAPAHSARSWRRSPPSGRLPARAPQP